MRSFVMGAAVLVLWSTIARAEVTLDWAIVGNKDNAADDTGYGSVDHLYRISKHEVTNRQYAEFLNAVDPDGTNPYDLYNTDMGSGFGGIGYNPGNPSGSKYGVLSGRGEMPVNYVSFWDAIRFANWLNNGQGSGDTETGAYTLTSDGISGNTVARNPGWRYAVPDEEEWYKAAYYSPSGYFDYPTASNTLPNAEAPPGGSNSANFNYAVGDLTDVGAYTSSDSPCGTFDQGGNVWEWNETRVMSQHRGVRGGSFVHYGGALNASNYNDSSPPAHENLDVGFRVVRVPEPGSVTLLVCGLVAGLMGWTRRIAPACPSADDSQ